MRLFTRYVAVELLKVFTASLVVLTTLLVLLGVAKEAHEQGLGPAQIVQIVPYVLPDMLRFTIPATILFATCSVFGRMAAANEIVAIKSLGINPLAVMTPAFVLAFALSLVSFWLNDVAVTWGAGGVQRVVIDAVDDIAYGMLRTQGSFTSRQFSIIVQGVEGRKLIRPTFTFQARGDSPAMTVSAEEAELVSDRRKNLLKIICRQGTLEAEGRLTVRFDDTIEQELPLDKASPTGDTSYLPARMAMRDIPREIDETVLDIAEAEQDAAVQMADRLLTGDFNALAQTDWKTQKQLLQDRRNHLFRLKTEPPRRLASGFSCLCFVLIGAPMAIRLRNADFLTSFFICFLPILLGYYPLLAFGLEQAKSGALPPLIVWLGNIVLAAWGVWLIRKVWRY